MNDILYSFLYAFNYFILYYVILIALWQLVQTSVTIGIVYYNKRQKHLFSIDNFKNSPELIPISIIAPAFNEGDIIVESVKGMLSLDYPVYEVIVVNDGSTDNSLEDLIREFNLRKISYPIQIQIPCANIRGIYRNPKIPKLTIVDKENGGCKSDACNAGINISRYPYFISMDSDCLLDRDALLWISRDFMKNKNCLAVGGMMRISNGNEIEDYGITNFHMPKKWLARFQVLEYSRAFLMGRLFSSKIHTLLVISGAFGAFHKESVIQVGGYTLNCIGEDMDLVMKLHQYGQKAGKPYQIIFSPNANCWTQGPEKYKDLCEQRRRWHVGLMQVMYRFRSLMFNPKYKTIGLVGMPYQFLYELCSPIIEVVGIFVMSMSLYVGIITPQGFILFCTARYLLGLMVSIGSLLTDIGVSNRTIPTKDFILLIFLCLLDTFMYRPIILFFRIQAMLGYSKLSNRWKPITRQSFKDTRTVTQDNANETAFVEI